MKATAVVLALFAGLALASPLQDQTSPAPAAEALMPQAMCQSCCAGKRPPGKFCDCNIFGCNCGWYSGGGATKLGVSTACSHARTKRIL